MNKKEQIPPEEIGQKGNSIINNTYKNLIIIISQNKKDISLLKKEIIEKSKLNFDLVNENISLKTNQKEIMIIKQQLEIEKVRNEELKKEIENLNIKILEQHKNFSEEKRIEENKYLTEVNRLNGIIDSYIQRNNRLNMNELDNKKLNIQISQLKNENEKIIFLANQNMFNKDRETKVKLSKLKKKMINNINEVKNDLNKFNINYIDMSSRITLLQNHQLFEQLDYLEKQLEIVTKKNEDLEQEIFKLKKDINLHKEVEISLADKNKKLKKDLLKYKENNNILLEEKPKDESFDKNVHNISKIKMEKKIINLEKKLELKQNEYTELKKRNEYIENILKNQNKKYSNLYNYLEQNLNNFFKDENIQKIKVQKINQESLKKLEFNNLTKEEQFSVLIILMKYLIPLITFEQNNQTNNNSFFINNYKIKYNFNIKNKLLNQEKIKHIINKKKLFKNISIDNYSILPLKKNLNGIKSYESLPSIIQPSNLKKSKIISPKNTSIINSNSINLDTNI